MLMRLGGVSSIMAGGCIAEKVLLGPFLQRFAPALLAPSPLLGGVVSKLFGAVIVVNVVASSCMMIYLSFIPGGARKKFAEKAKKNGDEHADERFAVPKLYAKGFSQEAKEFNCHQWASRPKVPACSTTARRPSLLRRPLKAPG